MKVYYKNLLLALVVLAVLTGLYFYWKNLRGIGPAINPPSGDIADIIEDSSKPPKPGENKTDMPLKLPDGFSIEVLAKNLPGARVMAFDDAGNMWLSRTSKGAVTYLTIENGKVVTQEDRFTNLRNPHGIATRVVSTASLGSKEVYIAEEHRVSKVVTRQEEVLEKIADLPNGAGHNTRTIGFGPDSRLYVSIGSSCNVCNESDIKRAAISSMNPDGSDFKNFATGLRNTVFFTWNKDGKLWGTDMGRDYLGDNIPPDEINIIIEGKNYGWPVCYDDNIHDTNFDKNVYIQDPCNDKVKPQVKLQAHSAPLGLGFITAGFGPKDWEGDLIMAFHGSWNRTTPTGYKLVRVKLDSRGNFDGIEDFISGWLQGGSALGRPVDVLFHDKALYVSDDKAGVVYKITYNGNK